MLLTYCCQAKALRHADYLLYFNNNKPSECVQIKLNVQADSEGELAIQIPAHVDAFFVQDRTAKVSLINREHKLFLINQKPNTDVVISHEFCFDKKTDLFSQLVFNHKNYFFENREALILPVGKKFDDKWQFSINYNALPSDFSIVNSYPIKNKILRITDTYYHFSKAVNIFGEIKEENLKLSRPGNNSIRYIQLGSWQWLRKTPEHYIKTLLEAQRKFWDDDDFSDYVINFNEGSPLSNGVYARHYKNFISLSITPNQDNLNTSIIGISHELFHGWIGGKADFKNHQNDLTWFVEGFTEYYGMRFALETNNISLPEYVDYFNKKLIRYYNSPMRNFSRKIENQELKSSIYFYDFNMTQGTMLANKIAKLKDKNNKPLIDFILKKSYAELIAEKNADAMEQKKIVFDCFESFLGEEQWRFYQSLLLSTDVFDLNESDFDFPVKILNKAVSVPVYHFDMYELIANKCIKKLDINSPEYQAGLRENMQVESYKLRFDDKKTEVSLIIKAADAEQKTITFYPDRIDKNIPQLHLMGEI